MTAHWKNLDGLRGVLSLCVVLLHFGASSFAERELGLWPLRLGLAVDVFFLMSGFVLTHSARNGVGLATFAVKRVLRLMPVYLVTTVAAILVAPRLPGDLWAEPFAAGPLLGRDPVNFPAWSISWELFLPLAAVALPLRVPKAWCKPALAICLLALGLCDMGVAGGERLYVWRAAFGLAAGHLLYRSDIGCKAGFLLPTALVLGAILLAGALPALALLLPALAALAIVAGVHEASLFASRPAQWLGDISYTLYLAHVPVLMAMEHVVGGIIDRNPAAKLAGVAASMLCAIALTVLVERPFMALSARLQSAKRAAQ